MKTNTNPTTSISTSPATASPNVSPEASRAAFLLERAQKDGMHPKESMLVLKSDAIQGNRMSGDSSGIGNLDSYDDVIFPNAFSAEVIADFLQSGMICDAHDWSKVVGMPMVAEVRGNVLYTECEFHSDPASQAVKTKCEERLANGKRVGLSIGFGMYESSYKTFPNGSALLAYAQKNGYDLSLFDQEGIKACTGACRAILKIDKLYEYSPVPVPANPAAWATAMKAMLFGTPQAKTAPAVSAVIVKGEYFSEYTEAAMSMAAISRLVDALFYGILWDAFYYDDDLPLEQRRTTVAGALDEFKTIVLRVFDGILAGSENAETVEEALEAIKTLWPKPETKEADVSSHAGMRLSSALDQALAAVTGVVERARGLHDLRVKEHRTLSAPTREKLAAQREQVAACVKTIDDLLAKSEPEIGATEGATEAQEQISADAAAQAAKVSETISALQTKQRLREIERRELLLEGEES